MKKFEPLKEGDSVIIVSLPESLSCLKALIGQTGVVTFYFGDKVMTGVNINDGYGNYFFNRDNLELIKVKSKELQHA